MPRHMQDPLFETTTLGGYRTIGNGHHGAHFLVGRPAGNRARAFAQSPTPKLTTSRRFTQNRRGRWAASSLAVRGTKLWAGDCVASELIGTGERSTKLLRQLTGRPSRSVGRAARGEADGGGSRIQLTGNLARPRSVGLRGNALHPRKRRHCRNERLTPIRLAKNNRPISPFAHA
jgi:hypothetical protein